MLTVTILLDSVEKVQRFVSTISKYSCGFDVESGYSCVCGIGSPPEEYGDTDTQIRIRALGECGWNF